SFFFCVLLRPRHLHSFPTRRSSDLALSTYSGSAALLGSVPLTNSSVTELLLPDWAKSGGLDPFSIEASTTEFGRCQSLVSKSLRSEEHTSELQSRFDLVCRLLLDKK